MSVPMRLLRRFNVSAVCLSLSAIALGHSLQISNGFFEPCALKWLTAAFLLCVLGACLGRGTFETSRSGAAAVAVVLGAGVAWQVQQQLVSIPGIYLRAHANLGLYRVTLLAQVACIAGGLLDVRRAARIWFPAVLVAGLCLGAWMIDASPAPRIDVVEVHKEAIGALTQGQDPYLVTFRNIYNPVEGAKFYNPAAVTGGRVSIGYPYPPPSLLMALPGQVLLGDYRYAELALLVSAAGLIGYSRRGAVARLAACVLLTTPRAWFVIEQGWTEPIVVFMLALSVFLMMRNRIGAGWAVGLFGVTKQYLAFTGLSIIRFVFAEPGKRSGAGVAAVLAAAAVTLPFALWHPHAFMRNVVWLQMQEPFRRDSLSFLTWAAAAGIGAGSFLWSVGAATVGAVLSLVVTRNTAAGFATSVALTTFTLFAFGSKAFCNYYFFAIGALCCAIAAIPPARERGPEPVGREA